MKKFFASLLIFLFLCGGLFSQSEADFDSEPKAFDVKDIVIATGDVFLINMAFNSGARIFLQEEYSNTNLDTMKENLHRNWCWDKDGFFMNQAGHPYQGSLYFNAGRSNGLNFWQSFIVTAGGSLMWEEFGETTYPAVNDFITTPICGTIVGETLHRLYVDASEIFPPLAWLISPMDAINSMCKGKKPKVSGRTEEIDFIFHGGLDSSSVDFSDTLEDEKIKKGSGGIEFHVQYGNPDGHTTKEAFDLFTADLDFSTSFHYKIDYCIDGFLYSHALYFEKSEGTLGVNLLYEGEKSSEVDFSNAALGVKYNGVTSFENSSGKFRYFAQIDGIFLGTRGLYRLQEDIRLRTDIEDKLNPPRSYNFVGGLLFKTGFSLSGEKLGTLYGEGEVNLAIPYIYSKLEESEATKHFMAHAKLGYEHKITRHFTLGLSDSIIYKADWFTNEADTVQILNTAKIYTKIVFSRW